MAMSGNPSWALGVPSPSPNGPPKIHGTHHLTQFFYKTMVLNNGACDGSIQIYFYWNI
jgi:hypothetical protein